jgi:hypothetical protein
MGHSAQSGIPVSEVNARRNDEVAIAEANPNPIQSFLIGGLHSTLFF